MKGLQDYTTEQLQKELDKRNLEKYSDYEIQEEINKRNKERINYKISNNKKLLSACNKYSIDIDKIESLIIDSFYYYCKGELVNKSNYYCKERFTYIDTNDSRYTLKRNISSDEYILDSIISINEVK